MPRGIHFEIRLMMLTALGNAIRKGSSVNLRAGEAAGTLVGDTGPMIGRESIDVPELDEFATRVKLLGGEIVVPKVAIPGIGWLVYCKDRR
jgi:hypothetical protein